MTCRELTPRGEAEPGPQTTAPSTEAARAYERYLWDLIDGNERSVGRMVTEFKDLMREVEE